MNLAIELAPGHKQGLHLQNPVLAAAGPCGYGREYAKLAQLDRLGALVTRTTTLRPRRGHAQPRLVEAPAGLLHDLGLPNPGVRAVIRELAPIWARGTLPVIVSVTATNPDERVAEFAALAEWLEGVPGVAGLELNLAALPPSVGSLLADIPYASESVAAARSATSLPLIAKLPPLAEIVALAEAVVAAGVNAVSLIAPLPGLHIDLRDRRPLRGGLSGPAIRPVALRLVYEVAGAVEVPVIGIGGIATAEDALQFLLAGATAVQVGSAIFANPRAAVDVVEGIEAFLAQQGLADVRAIIGAARPAMLAEDAAC
jgi:dihydroorotate dehydrogenase (NAD+) catalytic subunit